MDSRTCGINDHVRFARCWRGETCRAKAIRKRVRVDPRWNGCGPRGPHAALCARPLTRPLAPCPIDPASGNRHADAPPSTAAAHNPHLECGTQSVRASHSPGALQHNPVWKRGETQLKGAPLASTEESSWPRTPKGGGPPRRLDERPQDGSLETVPTALRNSRAAITPVGVHSFEAGSMAAIRCFVVSGASR